MTKNGFGAVLDIKKAFNLYTVLLFFLINTYLLVLFVELAKWK